jgi:pyrroloquinoline quinone (PQQ) biosynthesis protein C
VAHEFFGNPFFQSLARGRYTHAQLRHFAIQYGYYNRHFPRVLGAAIAAMAPLSSWWIPLADNLWDEAGRGLPGRSHEELYKTFLLSVDPSLALNGQGLPSEPISPVVGQAIDSFINFFRTATPLQAMAAVGLGSELFAPDVMGRIATDLDRPSYNHMHRLNLTFWTVHAESDEPRHYQLCRGILEQFSEPADLSMMREVGQNIADSECAMYTGLHEEMMLIDDVT